MPRWQNIRDEVKGSTSTAPVAQVDSEPRVYDEAKVKTWADGYFCLGTAFSAFALSLLVFDEFTATRHGLVFFIFTFIGVSHLLWKFLDLLRYPSR